MTIPAFGPLGSPAGGLTAVYSATAPAVGLLRWVTSPEPASLISPGAWLAGHALACGALGWISGLYLGVLFARVEPGGRVDALPPSRLALLAALGGVAPLLVAALGMVVGTPIVALQSLVGLGAVSTVGRVALATSTQAAATRAALTGSTATPRLPAT